MPTSTPTPIATISLPFRSVTVVVPVVVLTLVTVPTTRLPPGSRLMNRFHGLTVAMMSLQSNGLFNHAGTGAAGLDADCEA